MAKNDSRPNYVFTGMILCSHCQRNFRHRVCGYHPHWVCQTYVEKGKAFCAMPQIRDEIIRQKACEVLKLESFDEKVFKDKISQIIALDNKVLRFVFKDKSEVDVSWDYISRRNSWTPEMKEKARQKAIKDNKKRKEAKNK